MQKTHVRCPRPPEIIDITAEQLLSNRFSVRVVRLHGTILTARNDETDPEYLFLMLQDQTDTCFISVFVREKVDPSVFVGAEVEVVGWCSIVYGKRRFIQTELNVDSINDIRILRRAAAAPPIDDLIELPPSAFSRKGRHSARGRVIAALNNGSIFIQTARFGVCRAELVDGSRPRYGDSVEIVGIPETDLYHINFRYATEKPIAPLAIVLPSAQDIHARELPYVETHLDDKALGFHGALVRLRGIVRKIPHEPLGERIMLIEAEDRLVPIAADALDRVPFEVGSSLEVTGVCIFDIDPWHPNTTFARVKGFSIIPRSADDIRILARPPWWTPSRLMAAIGILLAGLFAILVWNAALRRAAVRKGRELMREQLGVEREKMKTEERTRLAVELHDTLAQNLTGVSMEIAAGNYDIAAKALRSCRDELRNCLWDLRGRALEETNMTNAILRTLLPHANESQLKVRFEVSRSRFSDNAAHAVLSVIRELTINAIRHGDATTVQIAGALDADGIKCSVMDNGRGFNPDSCPGILQGHFGLQGIRERVEHLGGELTITSSKGNGTRAVFTITKIKG